MSYSSAVSFRLPETLYRWPWPRRLNIHHEDVKRLSASWLESFHAFSPKAQIAFNKCDFNLLASLAYPSADKERLRTGCDLMNLFFVIDEYSDIEDENTVQILADIVMDALRNPDKPRPAGESVAGEIARQFWERAISTASPSSQRRFIQTFDAYLQSVVQQAADRSTQHLRDVESYLQNRRNNIGAKPSFALLELDMDLPDNVLTHSALTELSTLTIDMLILGNDLLSYNVEQARGDDRHNIVTIIMHQFNTDVQGAMKWIAECHEGLVTQFLASLDKLPSWEPEVDTQVRRYVDGLGNWVRANDCWSFESQRYFGLDGLEIQESRWVTLLPMATAESGADSLCVGVATCSYPRLYILAAIFICVLLAAIILRVPVVV